MPLLGTFGVLGVFSYYPAISGLSRAFFNWQPGYRSPFVGWANFEAMLHDQLWWQSAGHVGELLLWGVTLGWLFPLLAAELVITLSGRRAQDVFRALLILPLAFPLVVQVLIWGFIYDPNAGVANRLFNGLGLGGLAHNWLGDPHTALYALIFMGFPWIASLPFLIFLGALQAIPREVYEAASVDGAGRWRRFRHIDLPLLRSQFVLLLVLAIIEVLQFGIPAAILTNGGPAFSTTFPVIYMLSAAFTGGEWGYAAALSSTLFMIILLLSAAVVWATVRTHPSRSRPWSRLSRRLGRFWSAEASSMSTRLLRTPTAMVLSRTRRAAITVRMARIGRLALVSVAAFWRRQRRHDGATPRGRARIGRQRSKQWRRRRANLFAGSLLSFFIFLGLFPFLFMLIGSFKNNAQLYKSYWVPTLPLHFANYASAWSQTSRYLMVTLIVAVATVAGVIVFSSSSAYIFARYRFLGRNVLFGLIAVLLMVPQVATIIPLFILVHNLGLLNTYWVLIVPFVASGIPFGVVLMRTFIQQLPDELFDAARVDGASGLRAYRHIVVPLTLPIMGTVAIFTAGGVWDNYFWPSLTITSDNLRTLPVGLAYFSGNQGTEWGPLFAGYTIASVPLVVLFMLSSRYFLAGLQGGVKGSG